MSVKYRYREITMSVRLPCTVTMTVKRAMDAEEDETWEVETVSRATVSYWGSATVSEALDADGELEYMDSLANKAEDVEV